ncbi:hypothetical protein DVH05_000449 [Phytophthora capsici]|nr:hypothetical protein DVH05_000449 [Phytophthora capsici]
MVGKPKSRVKRPCVISPHEPGQSAPSDLDDNDQPVQQEERTTSSTVQDEVDLPPHFLVLDEKKPRQSGSKTKAERDEMVVAHANVGNRLSPVARKGYVSWQSWISAFIAYCKTNCVGFRKRTSKSVEACNR